MEPLTDKKFLPSLTNDQVVEWKLSTMNENDSVIPSSISIILICGGKSVDCEFNMYMQSFVLCPGFYSV